MSEVGDFELVSPRSKYVVHSSGISEKVRVGPEYQAEIPNYVASRDTSTEEILAEEEEDYKRPMLMWNPISEVSEEKVQEFLHLATTVHGYSLEQAHGLLFWHKCNTEEARLDLTAYTPTPSEWNNEEREIFSQSVKMNRSLEDNSPDILEIHQDLPLKSVKSLVDYYYKWKGDNLRQSWTKRSILRLPDNGAILESAPKRYRTDSPNVRSGITRFKS